MDYLMAAAVFLNDAVLFVGFSLALVLLLTYVFREQKNLAFLCLCLLIGFLVGTAFKLFLAEERPCVEMPAGVTCPSFYSLPSLHSLFAFCIAIGSLKNRSFLIYLLYALFVAFSRVYLGVHTVADVTAGLGLAFFSCVIAEVIVIEYLKKRGKK